MQIRRNHRWVAFAAACMLQCAQAHGQPASRPASEADLSGVAAGSAVEVGRVEGGVELAWPAGGTTPGMALLRVGRQGRVSLSASIRGSSGETRKVFEDATPAFTLRVGERDLKPSGWTIFFDRVDERPFNAFPVEFSGEALKVESTATRVVVTIGPAKAGGFEGELQLTVFAGSPLVQVEAVMSTAEDSRAITFDGGLEIPRAEVREVGFEDWAKKRVKITPADMTALKNGPVRARMRTLVAGTEGGGVAVFPAPHQFFYPTDFANNFGFNDLEVTAEQVRIGVRQPTHADGRFRPWVNAPPGSRQHLCFFMLLSGGTVEQALDGVRPYTRDDRVPEIPGYKAMVSHVHVEHTAELQREQREAADPDSIPYNLIEPGWVKAFKDRGVQIVHLAEFHNGETPNKNAAQRVHDLRMLHGEAERLSNENFLILPGEEPNVHLGGHWISLFPRPVYWVLNRKKDEPFAEKMPEGTTLYRVGKAADVLELMKRENGLMWTAHPRIKASQGFPDAYMKSDYFASDHFLGGAWKAMPADFSIDRLGKRVLDLEDDMANRGFRKQILGEIDLFQLDPTYELYGHMNVNYVQLDHLPKFGDGWGTILDALRGGHFFTTTGEVLITDETIGGKSPGSTLSRAKVSAKTELRAKLTFTFPPAFAEVITGDGQKVYRQRIDLSTLPGFSTHELAVPVDLTGKTWARLEAWDVARNGAFTPAMWVGE